MSIDTRLLIVAAVNFECVRSVVAHSSMTTHPSPNCCPPSHCVQSSKPPSPRTTILINGQLAKMSDHSGVNKPTGDSSQRPTEDRDAVDGGVPSATGELCPCSHVPSLDEHSSHITQTLSLPLPPRRPVPRSSARRASPGADSASSSSAFVTVSGPAAAAPETEDCAAPSRRRTSTSSPSAPSSISASMSCRSQPLTTARSGLLPLPS